MILFLITSCEQEKENIPDLSTPEAAWKTSFSAHFQRNAELILDVFSHEILATYGNNREEQLKFIKQHWKGLKKDKKSRLEIIRTEYIDDTHANVFYNQFVGSKLWAENMRVLMIKEDGKWKVALDEKAFT